MIVDRGDSSSASRSARPLRRILCGVDFTSASRDALRHAVALAARCGAQLDVVHASAAAPRDDGEGILASREQAKLDAVLRAVLADPVLADAGVRASSCRVVAGSPAEVISARAEALASDVIVIGTHARSAIARLLIGSVADQVIRIAPVPVLTVPAPERAPRSPGPVSTILCAVDLSAVSAEALEHAVRLARALGASVHVLHVWQIPWDDLSRASGARAQGTDLSSALEALVRPHEGRGVALTRQLRCGDAALEIVEAARELQAERIVMATAGRRGLEHLVLGSVAEEVIRTSSVPVWTLRATPHESAER